MKHKAKPILSGPRVELRALQERDLPKVYAWKNDYELTVQIGAHPMPTSRHEVEKWFRKNQSDKNQYLFGIYAKGKSSAVGLARLMFIDWINSNAELGIYIADRKLRGRGLGRESVELLVDFAFRALNLHKVHLRVAESNKTAIELYRRCGFTPEGTLREHFWTAGRFEDVLVMGNVREEVRLTTAQGSAKRKNRNTR